MTEDEWVPIGYTNEALWTEPCDECGDQNKEYGICMTCAFPNAPASRAYLERNEEKE